MLGQERRDELHGGLILAVVNGVPERLELALGNSSPGGHPPCPGCRPRVNRTMWSTTCREWSERRSGRSRAVVRGGSNASAVMMAMV
jgi:hypothetical protein